MKKIDFGLYLNHPSLLAILGLGVLAICFLPPRLRVRAWKKSVLAANSWLNDGPEKNLLDAEERFKCNFCGSTRVSKEVLFDLPKEMTVTLFQVRSKGVQTYSSIRCQICSKEHARIKVTKE